MSNEDDETSSEESGSGSTASTGDESSTHESDYETATSSEEDDDDDEDEPNNNQSNIEQQANGIRNNSQSDGSTESDDDSDDDSDDSNEDGSTATDDTDDDDDDDDDDENDVESSPPAAHSDGMIKHSSDEDGTDSSEDTDNDNDEDEDSDDEDDEEAEPQLKYQRLGGGVTDKVKKDLASCLKCHPRFLVLGMKSGTVYVLDPHGDIIKQYRPHKNAVNDISIDQNGDHVATCSQDGRVVIRDIFKDVQTVHNFRNQDLLSIELHPNYGTQQMFVTGGRGQQLLLRSIGFFRSDNKVLHSGEGPIYCIAWQCELIAWANDRGVKIYDISDHKPIAHINRSNRGSPDPERYKCCLCWENRETLLIGWGDWVKIGRIRTVRTQQGHMMKEVHVTNVFITDFYICGIAPFKEHLILLAFLENDGDSSSEEEDDDEEKTNGGMDAGIGKSKPPELRIVSRRGEWIATDALPINKYKSNQAKDYKLVWSHDDVTSSTLNDSSSIYDPYGFNQSQSQIGPTMDLKNRKSRKSNMDETFYIVSPADIVASLPRTVEDHIKWLWEREEYEKAWRQSVLYEDDLIRSKLNPTSLGEEFLKYVLEEDEKSHSRFGDLCAEVCLKDNNLWEKWIDSLSQKGKLNLIIHKIPRDNPRLSKRSYELVLQELIKNDHIKFLECVKSWDSSLYDMKTILRDATNRLNEVRRSDPLIQALAELFRMDEEFDKALEYYLQLKSQLLLIIPQRYDIVYLMKDNEDYKYLKNETIDAMIRLDEEAKYNEKLNKIKQKKEQQSKPKIGYLLQENQHLNTGGDDELDEEQNAKLEMQRKLHNEELERISDGVFTMIIKHKLWEYIQDKIISLIELDIFRSSKLFLDYREDIHPKGANFVIEQVTLRISEVDQESKNRARSRGGHSLKLSQHNATRNSTPKGVKPLIYKKYLKFFMYLYLHELVGCGDGSQYPEFHDYLVALYAEFNTRQLINFLALSHHVKFSKALAVCEKRLALTTDNINKRNLNECYVFILNRMGNFTEALQVILIKLKDVEKAVKFVEQQADKSLWNHLIERTLRDAKALMPKLLDAVKGHPNVDAQELIQKIPNSLPIQGLKQKIVAIFEEYSREKLLTKGTTDILRSDCLKLGNKLYQQAAKGIMVNNGSPLLSSRVKGESLSICMVCQLPLKVYPSYHKEYTARIQKMEELQKLHRESIAQKSNTDNTSQSNNPFDKISAFGRITINKKGKNPFDTKVDGMNGDKDKIMDDDDNVNRDDDKTMEEPQKEIGSTRLNVLKKAKNPFDSDDTPLWKWSELSETLPSIKVFHCGHFYHVDCYREAQYDEKYGLQFDDGEIDKCLICFSGQKKKVRY